MESHQFWAFFVIAFIAGGAITLAISNATMTGAYFWQDLIKPPEPIEFDKPKPKAAAPAITCLTDCKCLPSDVVRILFDSKLVVINSEGKFVVNYVEGIYGTAAEQIPGGFVDSGDKDCPQIWEMG